jgi:hypothetical protein
MARRRTDSRFTSSHISPTIDSQTPDNPIPRRRRIPRIRYLRTRRRMRQILVDPIPARLVNRLIPMPPKQDETALSQTVCPQPNAIHPGQYPGEKPVKCSLIP